MSVTNVLGETRKKEQGGLGLLERLLNDCFNWSEQPATQKVITWHDGQKKVNRRKSSIVNYKPMMMVKISIDWSASF